MNMPAKIDPSIAPLHPRELERLRMLESYQLFGTSAEARFDEIVNLVAQICGSESALLSLVGEDSLWFKSAYNYTAESGPRDGSFCSHAILHEDVLIIEDATLDDRFNQNPLVTCPTTHVRFYAGTPLRSDDGLPLGVLCAIGSQPRTMTALQTQTLKVMANQIMAQMNLHRSVLRMQALNQSKDKFFAIIAHDLKAAFHGILGFSEVLDIEFDELDDPAKHKIATYLNECSHATFELLENLLEWATLENGSMAYRPKRLSLNTLIKDTVYRLQFMASQKNIELTWNLTDDTWVHGDAHMLQSLIHNLAVNAIKFTANSGKVQISDLVDDKKITILVQDNGTGMSEKQLAQLFAVEHSQSTKGTNGEKGTGLGLLLCKQFVQQHDGAIDVTSQLGHGTTFHVTLPLANTMVTASELLCANDSNLSASAI